MFPDARNSLRRWNPSAETKIPIPVAITLHNFVPPSLAITTEPSLPSRNTMDDSCSTIYRTRSNESDASQSSCSPSCSPSKDDDEGSRRDNNRSLWLHRQPQHNNNLLPRINLEITVAAREREVSKDDENNNGNTERDSSSIPTIVYSDHSARDRSVHPTWEHLDERISVDKNTEWWNQNDLYKSMKVRLSVASEENQLPCETDNNDEDCLLETYLHPSFLERIDVIAKNAKSDDDDDDGNSSLPPALPPNAMLVHFSDGSIRCPLHTYQILWEAYGHGILEAPPVEDFSRFEDDVFATLDHVKQTPQRPRGRSVSSLLDQDHDDSSSPHGPFANGHDEGSSPSSQHPQDAHPVTPPRIRPRNGSDTEDYSHNDTKVQLFCHSEQDFLLEERRQEKLELLRRIAEEEEGLKDDMECLRIEQERIQALMEEIRVVERETEGVTAEFQKQSLKLQREEFLKEAQSIKLFRDLKDIYPIVLDPSPNNAAMDSGDTDNYLIRGLRLPADIYTTSIVEEEVNTSLGYCAHLVFMVAKYLTIQLRHRIFCNGSRSAIELDGVGIFPLFMGRLAARALEREQVDRGARLLGENVNCVMMHLNLMPSKSPAVSAQEVHILARLRTILDFVAEGRSSSLS